MSNNDTPLPIACPECHYDGCMLVVRSLTVIMVKCVSCCYTWAAELDDLSEEIQLKIHAVIQDDQQGGHH